MYVFLLYRAKKYHERVSKEGGVINLRREGKVLDPIKTTAKKVWALSNILPCTREMVLDVVHKMYARANCRGKMRVL